MYELIWIEIYIYTGIYIIMLIYYQVDICYQFLSHAVVTNTERIHHVLSCDPLSTWAVLSERSSYKWFLFLCALLVSSALNNGRKGKRHKGECFLPTPYLRAAILLQATPPFCCCLSPPQSFYFRQLHKVSIDETEIVPRHKYSLLCVSNKYGLTIVGSRTGD